MWAIIFCEGEVLHPENLKLTTSPSNGGLLRLAMSDGFYSLCISHNSVLSVRFKECLFSFIIRVQFENYTTPTETLLHINSNVVKFT